MRINNNLMAMNTHRQLGQTTANGAKSMEKLSSGYRINRAGDDAAGLSISEKMRGQIRGLNQASRNAQDGISLIQTAEGALNETHSILQRMRELSVQSANDTNVNVDRTALQGEMDELAKEITRISNNTEFNTQKLVNGGITDTKFHVGANTGQDLSLAIGAMDAFTLGVAADKTTTSATLDAGADDLASAAVASTVGVGVVDGANITFTRNAAVTAVSGAVTTPALGANTSTIAYSAGDANGALGNVTIAIAEGVEGVAWSGTTLTMTLTTDATYTEAQFNALLQGATTGAPAGLDMSAFSATLSADLDLTGSVVADSSTLINGVTGSNENITVTDGTTAQVIDIADNTATSFAVTTGRYEGLSVQLATGSTLADLDGDQIDIAQTVVSAAAATINADGSVTDGNEAQAAAGLDITTQANASAAIETINSAIETVSSERSKLGSIQNRLEHTIKNLDTSSENLQASESRIRDVDMAKEMMEFTKNNILTQAAQAMLAQANQAPQGVLQLLR